MRPPVARPCVDSRALPGSRRFLLLLAAAMLVCLTPLSAARAESPEEGASSAELSEKELRYWRRQFKGKCSRCHGAKGDGQGDYGKGLDPRPADFTDASFMAGRNDDQLFHQIDQGGEPLSAMPAFGRDSEQGWSERKIRRMVSYLRTLPVDVPQPERDEGAGVATAAGNQTQPSGQAAEEPAEEGPKPIVPVTVKPGIAFYSDESGISGQVRGLLEEKNYEEVYQNYSYFEAWYDEADRVVEFREYRRGDVILTETYVYDETGRLSERRVSKPGEKPVVTRF